DVVSVAHFFDGLVSDACVASEGCFLGPGGYQVPKGAHRLGVLPWLDTRSQWPNGAPCPFLLSIPAVLHYVVLYVQHGHAIGEAAQSAAGCRIRHGLRRGRSVFLECVDLHSCGKW